MTLRVLDRLACSAGAATLAAVLVLGWVYVAYAHPQADDYAVAVRAREFGAAGYADFIYATKSGRWTGHALLALLAGHVDLPRAYPWLLAGIALVQAWAGYAFARTLLAEAGTRGRALALGLGFQALLWSARPAIDQTQYWFSGAVPYQLSLSAGMLLTLGLVGCSRRGRSGALAWIVLPAVAFAVSGLHELVGAMLAAVLGLGSLVALRSRSAARFLWLASALAVLAGFALNLIAPGNAARAGLYPEGGDVLLTLRYVALDWRDALTDWVLEPRLLAASAFLWLSPAFRAPRPRWLDGGARWAGLAAGAGILAVSLGFAGPRYATGTWQPLRMLDADYTVFASAWFVALFALTRGARGLPGSAALRVGLRVVALVALSLALVLTGNGREALGDLLRGRTRRWDRYMEQRYALIDAARGEGRLDVLLPTPPYGPRVFVNMDLHADRSEWENVFQARYFRLRSLALERPREAAAPAPPDAR